MNQSESTYIQEVEELRNENAQLKEKLAELTSECITEKENHKESEQRYLSLFNNSTLAIAYCRIITDESNIPVDFEIIDINEAYTRILGILPGEVKGKKASKVFTGIETNSNDYINKFAKVALEGDEFNFEAYSERFNIWLLFYVYSGKKGEFTIIFSDISERKLIEKELNEKAIEIESILSCIADGVLVYDKQGRITRANSAAERILKLRNTEKNLTLKERLPNKYRVFTEDGNQLSTEEMPAYKAAVHGETSMNNLLLIETENQETWVNLSAAPLIVNGKHNGGIISLSDVTSRKLSEQNLVRERELFEGIFNNIPVMITIYDHELKNVRFNKTFKDTLGLSEEDALKNDLMTLAYPDPVYRKEIADFMKNLSPGWREWNMTSKCGDIVESSWANIQLTSGILIGIGLDIRERKKAEEALKKSEERLRLLADNISQIAWIADTKGEVLWFNKRWFDYTGLTPEQSKTRGSVTHPNHAERVLKSYYHALSTGIDWEEIYPMLGKDGEYRWFLGRALPIKNDKDEVTLWFGTNTDVTELKNAQEALQLNEQRTKAIFEHAAIGICEVDQEDKFKTVNNKICEILGYSRQELLGKRVSDIINEITSPEDLARSLEMKEKLLKGELDSLDTEKRYIRHDGSHIWVHITVSTVHTQHEQWTIRTLEDITARKKAEESLKESEERFRDLADNIAPFTWMADNTGQIFWYNKRWFDYTGTTLEEMKGWGWTKVHHPDHLDHTLNTYKHAIETGENWEDVFPIKGKDGNYRWYISRALPIKDENGKILRWFGSNSDITDLRETQESLIKNEQRLQAMFNNAAIGIIETDHFDNIMDVNSQLCDVLGYEKDELIGKSISEITSVDDRKRSDEMNLKLHNGELKLFKYEKRYVKKDGSPIWVSVTVSAIYDSDGKYINSIGTVEDISERKQFEEALKKSEESLRLVIEAAELGTWDFDIDTGIAEHSFRHDQIFGYSEPQKEWSYEISIKHMLPEFEPVVREAYDRAIKTGILNYEAKVKWPDESIHWIAPHGRVQYSPEGKPLRMAGIVADVTERKMAEEAVKESEETFSTMFHALPIGISLASYPDEKLTNVNKAWLTLAEYTDPNEVLGKTKIELGVIKEQDMERINAEFNQYGNVRNCETTFFSRSGQQNVININKDVIHIAGKKFILSTNEDITNQKKYEQEIKQKNEELTRFIYTVSHDLKSPLVTIKSFTSYLKEDIEANDKEAQDKDIGYIENAADKMGRLLDELLELSRIGRKEEPKTEIPLETVAKMAVDLVAGRISQRKVKISFSGPPVMLYGFTQRFVQLFQNLIDNAVKFMGNQQDPLIEIGSYQDREKNDIVIFVRDNGSGIDPRYHHKIFGLFEKMDNKTEGSGIGLALVKRIVEVHEGSIWFESKGLGKGTTFYFTLKRTHLIKNEQNE